MTGKAKLRLPLSLFFLLLIPAVLLIFTPFSRKDPVMGLLDDGPEEVTAAPSLVEHVERIERGTPLAAILSRYNFSAAEIHELRERVKPIYDLNRIRADHEIRLYTSEDGRIEFLEYDIDSSRYLLIQHGEEGFSAEIRPFPFEIKTGLIWGIIEDNPISAFNKKNEGDHLALAFAELFAWDVDFYTDLRRRDSFKVIFEKRYLGDRFIGYGDILAAEFVNQGKTFQAFRYAYPDTGNADYFDARGNSLRKEFLKSPISYARITSRFSLSRLHPIRKVYRPHYGVDYAARVGTPVQATADGTVTFSGWEGAAGRMVRIRHKNEYETMYLHLRNFGPGIKKGARVKAGQMIGYVGSSGESTGPHLDYRIRYRGKYINPLAWRFKPVEPLRPEYLEDFKKEMEKYCLVFDISRVSVPGVLSLF